MQILAAKLESAFDEQETREHAAERKAQIGTGDRSEKSALQLPQDRVTDHRLKESWHNLPKIMAGDIEDIISALRLRASEDSGTVAE